MKVAVLCSHRAPGLVSLLNHDPRRGVDYEIVCWALRPDGTVAPLAAPELVAAER